MRVLTKAYVVTIAVFGVAAIALAIPQLREAHAGVFTTLAILSLVTAFAKVNVPMIGGTSTLSVCYVVDFTALLVLGIPYATLTSAAGVWAQCTFNSRYTQKLHQTWFSIGALALTVYASAFVYQQLGGVVGRPQPFEHAVAITAAAATYFLMNSVLVAGAIAMSASQSVLRTWWSTYAPMWRGHFLGFAAAAVIAAGIAGSALWLTAMAACIIALTHRNLRAYVDGLVDSNTDALTRLPNRRCLESRVQQEIARATRDRSEVATIVIDVNLFKQINDTHGHAAGDLLLREIASRIQRELRTYDICARFGGDEFVVVLPGCSLDDAQHKAEALRQAVQSTACDVRPGVTVPVSISLGTAAFPRDGRTFEAVFTAADKRMYDDKHSVRARRAAAIAQPALAATCS